MKQPDLFTPQTRDEAKLLRVLKVASGDYPSRAAVKRLMTPLPRITAAD